MYSYTSGASNYLVYALTCKEKQNILKHNPANVVLKGCTFPQGSLSLNSFYGKPRALNRVSNGSM